MCKKEKKCTEGLLIKLIKVNGINPGTDRWCENFHEKKRLYKDRRSLRDDDDVISAVNDPEVDDGSPLPNWSEVHRGHVSFL